MSFDRAGSESSYRTCGARGRLEFRPGRVPQFSSSRYGERGNTMRKRSAIGAVAAAMLAAGGAGVPAVAGAGVTGAGVVGAVVHAPMRHIGATQYSSNWSGYAL